MLKLFAAATLGTVVLFVAIGPAAADKGARWAHRGGYVDRYPSTAYGDERFAKGKRKFAPRLDFETNAVWHNLRPEWFD